MADKLQCKNKGAALAILDTLAGACPRGTQRDAILAVREWFVENFPPEFSEETEARLQRIFEGDEAEMAYHVGAKAYTPKALGALGHFPNLCTIGIELCHPGADGRFSAETLGAAAELCALLCIQGGLDPLADIWTHHDITGKDCPKWFVERPEEFAEFKQGVSKIANWLRG